MNTVVPFERALLLAGLLLTLPAFAFVTLRVRQGHQVLLRSIPGMDFMARLVGRALEEGKSTHLSVGVGKLGEASTAETMAGLTALDVLAERCSATGVEPLVTVPDPALLPLTQDVIQERRTPSSAGRRTWATMSRARFMGPDATAYAVGAMDTLQHEALSNSVTIGPFGPEFLLIGEAGAQEGLAQVAGTTNPEGLPYMKLTADHTLVGEELFATGAYLAKWPSHLASLVIQDAIRLLIVLVIVLGVALRTILR